MKPDFNSHYTGFYGQINEKMPGLPPIVCWELGNPGAPFLRKNGAIQWFRPFHPENGAPLPLTSEGQLFLAGLVWPGENRLEDMVHTIVTSITGGNYRDLALFCENAAGCLIKYDGTIYFWVGLASNDHVFFRMDRHFSWSTNPLDLIVSEEDLDLWALRRCCHGDDAFIYHQEKVRRVEQGHLVRLEFDGRGNVVLHDVAFDRFLPDPRLTGTITLEKIVQLTREALLNAVQPLACSEPVGIMLSGGSGSAALLHALKQVGANVVAYHIESQEPSGSEYRFARMTCEALDVPLVRLSMSSGPDYLSPSWEFSHPDGHPWVRWFEQIAQRARQDGITLMVTGVGDDHAFGPEMEYGVHSILSARISWKEKRKMLRGLLATDWNIFDLLRSAWPWPPRQLIGLTYLAGPSQEDRQMRKADFLTPLPPYQRERDAALLHSPCFTPQNMAVEHSILQPNGIRLYYPYHHRAVQAISLALPAVYRLMPSECLPTLPAQLLPDLERVVAKPVLRLACHETPLPLEIVWRTWSVCTQAPIQAFCLNHPQILQDLLGNDSYLAKMKMLDPSRLKQVLESRTRIRDNYTTLVASALVELFLKKAFHDQWERGGPRWK